MTKQVAEAGGYLPVDAPFADATSIEAARSNLPRPRELAYGEPSRWLLEVQGESVTWRIAAPPASRRGLASPWDGLRADAAIHALGDATAVVMADLMVVPGAGAKVVCVLEGATEETARGYRTVWAALERAGGRVQRFDAPGAGEWPAMFPSRASGGWTTLEAREPLRAEVVDLLLDFAPDPGRVRLQLLAGTGAVAWEADHEDATGQREWLEGRLHRLGCRVGYIEPTAHPGG